MADLLQNNPIKLDESIKSVLTSRLQASVSATDSSANFGEIFANATKKQNELMTFANNKTEVKTQNKNEVEVKTTENTKINKKEEKKQVNKEEKETQEVSKDKTINKEESKKETTTLENQTTQEASEETLLMLGSASQEIKQATAEMTLIQTQKNNDFEKMATLEENAILEGDIEDALDVEVENIDTENIGAKNQTETLKGRVEENQIKISTADTKEAKETKSAILVEEKNINIDKNIGEVNIHEPGEIDVQNMVEAEILEELNLSVDDVTITAKAPTSPLVQDATEQLFKMSLEKTASKIPTAGLEKTQGIQGIQNAQGSANASESNNSNNNLNFQNMDKKLEKGKEFLNKMSEKAKMANIQKNDILNQIGAKFEQLKDNVTSKITLTLRPENLGRVVIEMSHDKNGVTTNILAQNQDVKEILEKNISALKEQLTSAGVQVDNISIKAPEGNENANFFSQNNFADEGKGQQSGFENRGNKNFSHREEKQREEHFFSSKEETVSYQEETYHGIKVGQNVYSI